MPGLVGKTLGRYEIVDLLGAGGMGEVYRARDTQLSRPVAIKVISEKVTQSRKSIDRFEREARTVAQLSHPNILNIHDFGRDGGVVYAVTELLEGQDLRDRMRGSMLPLSKALEIGRAVANGLAAAHSKGIIHRDIKPENIFITSTGQVKILDFGIAGLKVSAMPEAPDTEALTESLTLTGDVLGTVGYMSPEQVRGEKVDQRSDIFALGCLLYEVLTGHRAFKGETSHDTVMAILNRDPDPIADYRTDVSPGLEAVVRRCLEKQSEERFESARDVAFALQAISDTGRVSSTAIPSHSGRVNRRRGAAMAAVIVPVLVAVVAALYWSRRPINLPQVKHLAVLDFEATPEDIDLQQMADGLAEQVADTLAVMEQATHGSLWTVRRGLARDWGYSDPDLLRRTFNISLAVKGQVARNDQQIELTLEIADPITGHPLRSRTIQALPGNLSSLQHEPALALVELLTIEIDESTRELLTADTTNVMGVIEPFLRGRGILSWASTVEEIDTAVDLLETAAKADPLFDAPRLALARAHLRRFEFNKDEMEIDAGILNAEIVLSHERRVAEANLVLAGLHRAAGRAELAVTGIEKAIEVEPFNPELQLELAFTHQELGDNDRAEDAFNHAIYLRPGYWPDHYWLAVHYLGQGRYDGAAIQFRHVIQSAPEHIGGYNNLGAVYLFVGRREEAKQLFERSMAINSETNYVACSNLGTLYYWDSRFADAQAMFERAVAIDDSDYEVWGNLAQAYAAGHEPANAIEPFQRAIELAEAQLPGDAYLLTNLATYHASLGNDEAGLRYLDMAEEHGTTDPAVIANIAEAYEDLGHREQALEWVGRAVENGAEQSRFENRPSLRALVSDKRYRQLFADTND